MNNARYGGLDLHRLKKIEIVLNAEDHALVEDLLKAAGIGGWTIIRDVAGMGHSGFHQGKTIFNDQSGLVMFVGVADEKAIIDVARGLARLFERELLGIAKAAPGNVIFHLRPRDKVVLQVGGHAPDRGGDDIVRFVRLGNNPLHRTEFIHVSFQQDKPRDVRFARERRRYGSSSGTATGQGIAGLPSRKIKETRQTTIQAGRYP